jgi:hypothetical protein
MGGIVVQGGENAGPKRRSARNAGKVAPHYSDGSQDEEGKEGEPTLQSSPQVAIPHSSQWATASPHQRLKRKPRVRKPGPLSV